MTFSELQRMVHRTACEHGWHDDTLSLVDRLGRFCSNVHSEVSEAWEEVRVVGRDEGDLLSVAVAIAPDGKPVGFPTELADIVIRVMDTAEALGIDLESEIKRKDAFNRTRPYRHGGKIA